MSSIKIEHTSLTDVGLVREANEDSFGHIEGPYGPVFTVCDGMGGHVGGATASNLAVKSILDFITTSTVENPSVTINNAIISANQKLLEEVRERPELRGMGTTVTVLVVQPEGVYFGHIGDSRIYILSNNKLQRLTRDDSFVQTLVDSGVITDEEAEHHPRKNELMKALGIMESIQPSVAASPVKPKQGDVFMLCSDGLCGLVNDAEMERILTNSTDLEQAAQQLIAAAKNAGGNDNITVQLIKITASPYEQAMFESVSPAPVPPVKLNQHIQEKPVEKLPPPKKSKRLTFLFSVLGILVLLVAVGFFWNPFTPTVLGDNGSKPAELLPGDSIVGDYLVHFIDHKKPESLNKVVEDRKNSRLKAYKAFSFDSTYSDDGITLVKQQSLANRYVLKWRKKTDEVDISKITVTADHPVTSAPAPKPADTVKKQVNTDSLKTLLDKAKDSVINITLEIKHKEKEINDTLTALKSRNVPKPEKAPAKKKLDSELERLNTKFKIANTKVAELEKKVKDAGKQH